MHACMMTKVLRFPQTLGWTLVSFHISKIKIWPALRIGTRIRCLSLFVLSSQKLRRLMWSLPVGISTDIFRSATLFLHIRDSTMRASIHSFRLGLVCNMCLVINFLVKLFGADSIMSTSHSSSFFFKGFNINATNATIDHT